MPTPVHAEQPDSGVRSLEDRIRRRAYELDLERGRQPGLALDDWLQAEKEIRGEEFLRDREGPVEEASKESFPASDPPA